MICGHQLTETNKIGCLGVKFSIFGSPTQHFKRCASILTNLLFVQSTSFLERSLSSWVMGLCKSGEILGIFHQLDPNFQTLRLEETHPEYLLQGSYHIILLSPSWSSWSSRSSWWYILQVLVIIIIMLDITAMAMLILMMILVWPWYTKKWI